MNKYLKKILKPAYKAALLGGFNPTLFRALKYYPRYRRERNRFIAAGGAITHSYPILTDYTEQAGTASGHYFHQDLLVASFIYQAQPKRHIDVGSRVDGFVAHVATFREIEVMDVRAMQNTGHENIKFLKSDLMDPAAVSVGMADSVSCLHALEHFGLGRYGDRVDPDGHRKGFRNLIRMVSEGGRLYISFPIASSEQVHFNAHRVFRPHQILEWLSPQDGLSLTRFDYVDDSGILHQIADPTCITDDLKFGCGIYSFQKSGNNLVLAEDS
ncbi:MAG TPA: DUF268 domain-containing protein [Castellaniella sp.]|uniref:DUF268 domain-containing protein n=1 Tax=Castellaniella sp. TaxID=1955812 RepID=UPI002F230763